MCSGIVPKVKEESGQSCVVAGNSLGGFTALYAAASEAATAGTGNFTDCEVSCSIKWFFLHSSPPIYVKPS